MTAVVALVLAMAGCSSGSSSSDLVGPSWQWTHLSENQPKHQSVVPDPQNYTLTLADDGTFQAKADCNNVSGTYTTSGSTLTLKPGPSTLAACGPNSLDAQYVSLLHAVSSYSVDGSDLTLQLAADAGDMGFTKA
jgi:heat shock protein HslJ